MIAKASSFVGRGFVQKLHYTKYINVLGHKYKHHDIIKIQISLQTTS